MINKKLTHSLSANKRQTGTGESVSAAGGICTAVSADAAVSAGSVTADMGRSEPGISVKEWGDAANTAAQPMHNAAWWRF